MLQKRVFINALLSNGIELFDEVRSVFDFFRYLRSKRKFFKIKIMVYEKLSKRLSFVLRHKPESIGSVLDENGYADVAGID